ncbi:hypothetical protein PROFUN_03704 [Planoprotostelium fungivorum]|uniref:Uncharacterized protein n=1 Tax=Planoprotostelium fungivorum TaxID=1890364 RepID=A0A2P6NDH7_9EUKA|nr:hypothetical protein PROFUN_03704 [Planoprotostelium fungivorum]
MVAAQSRTTAIVVALMTISWQKQRRREFIVLCEEMFIFNQTHKHAKLVMSEKVGGHSLPNGTQTTDNKYETLNGSWKSTGIVQSPSASREVSYITIKSTICIHPLPQRQVMPRSFKRKGRKSSTPPAKVARTPQSSERSNSKQVEEDSPSVPSSPTSESADREVASPIGGGEDNEREDNSNQPEAEENDHPPGMNRQLFNMINGLQAMVMSRSFKRKGRKSSTPPAKVACTPQSSERSNSKQVEEDSPSVPSSPTSESADREVASPIGGGEDNEREDNSNQPEAEENDHPPGMNRQLFNMINAPFDTIWTLEENNHPPGMNRQLFNMINSLQAMVDENRSSTESNIDRLKTSLVNVTSLITSVQERLPPKPVTVTATTGAGHGWLILSNQVFIDSVKAKGPTQTADDLEQASYSRAFYYGWQLQCILSTWSMSKSSSVTQLKQQSTELSKSLQPLTTSSSIALYLIGYNMPSGPNSNFTGPSHGSKDLPGVLDEHQTETTFQLDIWLTLSDEDFIDSVKAKGPAHSADHRRPRTSIILPSVLLWVAITMYIIDMVHVKEFIGDTTQTAVNGALQVVAAFDHFILDSLIFDWVRYAFWTKLQFHRPFTWIKRFAEGFGRAPN